MALTQRYVSSSGTDTYANSTNPSTPCSLTTAFANVAAGDVFNVKKDGTYTRTASDTVSASGSAAGVGMFRAYNTVIGDCARGRNPSGGANPGRLDATNFATIAYNSGFRLNVTGTYLVFEGFEFTGSFSGGLVTLGGVDCHAAGCKATNSSTNAAAVAFDVTAQRSKTIDCDGALGASGGTAIFRLTAANTYCIGCRATGSPAAGIAATNRAIIAANIVAACALDGIALSGSADPVVLWNTVHACGGDGIDMAAAMTVLTTILANHLTDNGGYGINANGASCAAYARNNRFRDNTLGKTSGAADWLGATDAREVTTDLGGSDTDYINPAVGDYALRHDAAGARAAMGYLLNIGGAGSPQGGLMHPLNPTLVMGGRQ